MSAVGFKISVMALVCMGIFTLASIQDHAGFSKEGRGPVMRVSEKMYQFGEVNPWEMPEHTFTVFNDGKSVLRIDRVSPD
jgi:hypothetical protein